MLEINELGSRVTCLIGGAEVGVLAVLTSTGARLALAVAAAALATAAALCHPIFRARRLWALHHKAAEFVVSGASTGKHIQAFMPVATA